MMLYTIIISTLLSSCSAKGGQKEPPVEFPSPTPPATLTSLQPSLQPTNEKSNNGTIQIQFSLHELSETKTVGYQNDVPKSLMSLYLTNKGKSYHTPVYAAHQTRQLHTDAKRSRSLQNDTSIQKQFIESVLKTSMEILCYFTPFEIEPLCLSENDFTDSVLLKGDLTYSPSSTNSYKVEETYITWKNHYNGFSNDHTELQLLWQTFTIYYDVLNIGNFDSFEDIENLAKDKISNAISIGYFDKSLNEKIQENDLQIVSSLVGEESATFTEYAKNNDLYNNGLNENTDSNDDGNHMDVSYAFFHTIRVVGFVMFFTLILSSTLLMKTAKVKNRALAEEEVPITSCDLSTPEGLDQTLAMTSKIDNQAVSSFPPHGDQSNMKRTNSTETDTIALTPQVSSDSTVKFQTSSDDPESSSNHSHNDVPITTTPKVSFHSSTKIQTSFDDYVSSSNHSHNDATITTTPKVSFDSSTKVQPSDNNHAALFKQSHNYANSKDDGESLGQERSIMQSDSNDDAVSANPPYEDFTTMPEKNDIYYCFCSKL